MDEEIYNTLLKTMENLKMVDNEIPVSLWRDIEMSLGSAEVPQVKAGEERPCERSDFEKCLPAIELRVTNLLQVLRAIDQKVGGRKRVISKVQAAKFLLLCGEHSCDHVWTTEKTVCASKQIQEVVCRLWQCSSVSSMLTGADCQADGLFRTALILLRPKLLKHTWRMYPAAVACYWWMLNQVKSPHLGVCLGDVMPTALLLLDDYVPDNRILGIHCIHYIVDNVTRTELGWQNHGNVIYKALEHLLYERKAAILGPLISCLVPVLDKVEGSYVKGDTTYEWNRYDDVLEKLLSSMEGEDRLALRMTYITHMPPLLEAAGLRLCRWSKRLLRVCERYLEVAGYCAREEALHTLKMVQVFVEQCWPVVPNNTHQLLQMLLKLLVDVTESPQADTDGHLVQTIEDCLSLIVSIAPEQSEKLSAGIKEKARFNDTFSAVVDRVFP